MTLRPKSNPLSSYLIRKMLRNLYDSASNSPVMLPHPHIFQKWSQISFSVSSTKDLMTFHNYLFTNSFSFSLKGSMVKNVSDWTQNFFLFSNNIPVSFRGILFSPWASGVVSDKFSGSVLSLCYPKAPLPYILFCLPSSASVFPCDLLSANWNLIPGTCTFDLINSWPLWSSSIHWEPL